MAEGHQFQRTNISQVNSLSVLHVDIVAHHVDLNQEDLAHRLKP
jgi:hypothetical protein